MSAVLSTVLITAPLAFLVGWLASKAVFRHMSLMRPNATLVPAEQRPSEPVAQAPTPSADAEPEVAFAQVTRLKQQLSAGQTHLAAARSEIQALREAVAEREHRMAELGTKLQVAHTLPEDTEAGRIEVRDAHVAKQLRKMQQRAEHFEQHNVELRRELIGVERRLGFATSRFHKWRTRFHPLAKQFRQQKFIINELREELRHREQAGRTESAPAVTTPPPVMAQPETRTPEQLDQQLRDDLQQLQGIGPALHRKLNDRGIYRLQQLAALNTDELLALGKTLGVSEKLMRRHDWASQARIRLGLTESSPSQAPASASV